MFRPLLGCISVCMHHPVGIAPGIALSSSALSIRSSTARTAAAAAIRSSLRRISYTALASTASMAVDVTKDNLQDMLPAIRDALDRCTFFSFDCEMTGLFTDGNKHEYLDDMQARYSKMSESSKAYIITQYGISCFQATGPASYEARTFNFYLFPQPHGTYNRRFLCDASSLAFLASHGFDFNKCISQGAPYMPCRSRDFQLLQVNRNYEPRSDPVMATSDEDRQFTQQLVQLVTDWIGGSKHNSDSSSMPNGLAAGATTDEDQPGSADELETAARRPAGTGGAGAGVEDSRLPGQAWDELALPPMNSYKRLLAYQELRKAQFGVEGHPGFWVKKLPDSRFLVLVRASAQQAEQLEAAAKAARIAAIHEAAGFAAVFDLMRRCGKPAVGHNCMFDVAYGLYSFADAYLPATWRDYKKMVMAWHPGGIYDTKFISKQLPEVFQGNTSLSEVYTTLLEDGQAGDTQQLLAAASAAVGVPVQLPRITHAPGFDKYRALGAGEAAHEAGYDAYMTGAAFACLLPLVAGKVAADPACPLAAAYRAATERQAAAAAAAAGKPLESSGRQQQVLLQAAAMPQTPPPGQQQQDAGHQQQQQPQIPADLLHYVQGVRGRLNITFSDIAYAALCESDPIPERPCVFHLSGLAPGYRQDDVWKMLQRSGLGSARITSLDSSSCLAEFKPECVPGVAQALADLDRGVVATPWDEWAYMRYNQRVPEPEDAAAAAAAGVEGGAGSRRGVKRVRLEEGDAGQGSGHQGNTGTAAAAAVGAATAGMRHMEIEALEEEGSVYEEADELDEPKSGCRIM